MGSTGSDIATMRSDASSTAPDSSPAFVPVSSLDLPPASELLTSLPVYLNGSLAESSSLHVFQYPIYARDRPLPVPASAAARGLKVSSRWRPKANRVEVELPLDVRTEVYNTERGADFGAGADVLARKQERADLAHVGSTSHDAAGQRVKREDDPNAQRGPQKLEKMLLESSQVPNATQYMVGVIREQALHLTRLRSIVQLRPSMNYLDAIDEAREAEKRRDRAALAGEAESDQEDEEELIEMEASSSRSRAAAAAAKKDVKKPIAQTLSVALRGDPNAKKTGSGMGPSSGSGSEARDHLMAAQREADAERWLQLDWQHDNTPQSDQVFESKLFATTHTLLECKTRPRDYLLHSTA